MNLATKRGEKTPTHVVGIDLGGTKVHAGIATKSGHLLAERILPTPSDAGALPSRLAGVVRELADESGIHPRSIGATGVGGAGVPWPDGSFNVAPNLGGIELTPFARDLSAALGHHVVLENDANVAALGELWAGVGRTYDDFVVVAVGTGIGMGIVSGGRLIRGARGAAGEIGFLPIGSDPLDRRHHRRGPLEESVAGDVLGSRLLDPAGQMSALQVFELAAAGVTRAAEAIDQEARWLAAALVAVAAVLDPAVVVLTGGIGSRVELQSRVQSWLPRYGADRLKVQPSELGPRAPVLGAIRLAIDSLPQAAPTKRARSRAAR